MLRNFRQQIRLTLASLATVIRDGAAPVPARF